MSKNSAKRRATKTQFETVDEIIADIARTNKADANRLLDALRAERKQVLNAVCDFYIAASIERNQLDRYVRKANTMVELMKLRVIAMPKEVL